MKVWQRTWKKADGTTGRSDVYSYRFQFDGVLQTGSTGERNERDALRFAKEFRNNLMTAKAQALLASGGHPTKTKNMTVGQACRIYYESRGKDAANAAYDYDNLLWIERKLGPSKLVTEIVGGDVARLVQERKAEGNQRDPNKPLSGATINRNVVELLKRVLRWAEENEGIIGIPKIKWRDLKQGETGERKRIMTSAELTRLRDAMLNEHGWRDAVEFDLICGLRRENFTALKWSEVYDDENVIKVIQKGGGLHRGVISPRMRELIDAQKDANGNPYHPEYVFTFIAKRTSSDGQSGEKRIRGQRYPITYDGFGTWWGRICKKAKVTDLRIHDIRRTAGSNANLFGGLKAAQELLGHADVATTAKYYTVMTDENMLDILNKVSSAGK